MTTSHASALTNWRSALWWLVFCLGVLAACVFLSWLAPIALYFHSTYPVPVRANPYVLTSSVLGAATCFGLLYYLSRRHPGRSTALMAIFVAPILIAIGAFVVSLSPAQGSLVHRDQVYSVPMPSQQSFAVSFLFDNAKDSLSAFEIRRLKDEIDIFDSCAPSDLYIRGFASSTPYATDSDQHNKALANRRANAVADALRTASSVTPKIVQWDTYDEMRLARRIRDVDETNSRRLPASERLNRRVEMYWQQESCLGSGSDS